MNSTALPSPSPPERLPRVLGPWITTAIVVGTVIGSGVFKKATPIAKEVPDFGLVMAAWILGGVMTLLGALALAEVAVLFPHAGGNYVFLREAFGRLWGFLWGWVEFWIMRAASIAALATIFSESLHDVLREQLHPGTRAEVIGYWPRQLLTVAVIATLAAVNARGTRLGGGLQFVLTLIKVGSILGVITLPFVILAVVSEPTYPPDVAHFSPTWPADWSVVAWGAFGSALISVLWAYDGWTSIAPIAGEVKDPQHNLPRALLGGVFLLIALYVGANAAYYFVIPRDEIAALKGTPVVTEFALRLLGPVGLLIASAAVMTSVFGALNGNMIIGPRLLYAMGEDRLAPRWLSNLHPRYQTPAAAIGVLAVWSCLLVLVGGAMARNELPTVTVGGLTMDLNVPKDNSPFDLLTDFAIFGAITFETLAVASIFVFRRTLADVPRVYRCVGYPWVPIAYILIKVVVVGNMFAIPEKRMVALSGTLFIAAGAVVYALFLRQREVRIP